MSVFAAFQSRSPFPATHARGGLRAFLTAFPRRISDNPLDHSILRLLDTPAPERTTAPARKAVQLHAHWRTVTGPDGSHRIEAGWHGSN
ncbi:hypothetical protein P3T36_003915 [Kitasatospora sp. MAP12-15]|uniref:hypothetical protein n=1 Tax=unclassified Kitasatospora TaxID=2633591 RepID=UPI0024731E1A|nr:hypothetical protein [Kitasatospora sp. MAP12-44]MDH6108441.1 hypothetical protein [Kitasatospora sp. MAP12-44]